MTPDSTEQRLHEIRERAAAIIPGPWRWMGNTATDQVFLGTTNRGRLYIMDTHTREVESVYNHRTEESYTPKEARERVIDWCGQHDEDADPVMRQDLCRCDEVREFLAGNLDPSDPYCHARDLVDERTGYAWLSRAVTVHPDLRFPDDSLGDRRGEHGGMMRSYREVPRYEVLGYRTRAEFEAAAQLPEEQARGVKPNAEEALYREDFVGLDQPEATFIEHSAEDIPFLLAHIAQLESERADLIERLAEATL